MEDKTCIYSQINCQIMSSSLFTNRPDRFTCFYLHDLTAVHSVSASMCTEYSATEHVRHSVLDAEAVIFFKYAQCIYHIFYNTIKLYTMQRAIKQKS